MERERKHMNEQMEDEFGHDDVQDEVGPEEVPEEEEELPKEEESLPDSLPEESMADYPEEEEVKPRKQRDKSKTRINQIQREKYRALHEADQLRQENDQLRQLVDTSSQVAIKQYDDLVNKRLEDARSLKIQAIESGDPVAITDADARFTFAVNELQQLNDMKVRQEYERNQNYYQQQLADQQAQIPNYEPYVQDWVQRNEWFNPDSESFDEELAETVDKYTQNLNSELVRMGYENAILSPHYFAEVDRAAQAYQAQRNSAQRGGLNMKQARGGANPVRYAPTQTGAGQPRQREVALSADERDMARRMGVSDKVYLAERIKDEQINGFRRRGGR